MKQVCMLCERTSPDGNLFCQETYCPAEQSPFVLDYGEWFGDIEIVRLLSQGNLTRMAWGGLDFTAHLAATSAVAFAQNSANAATQFLPADWQVAIDRQFDHLGRTVSDAPPPSRWIPDATSSAWFGFWD
jgi:hypothetical protein